MSEIVPKPSSVSEPINETEEKVKDNEGKPLSKNQLKKIEKRKKWLEFKAEKRAKERQKRKRKYAEAREQGISLGPSRKSLKYNKMCNSSCKSKVVIDCSFDNLMNDKDMISMTNQLCHAYAVNRRAENPMQFYITNIDPAGKLNKRLIDIGEYKGWDVHMKQEDYMKIFDKDKIVYLTSDSPNILSSLDDDKVYIIGGLIDHNHHKNHCYNLALEKGLQHAQLPIGEFLSIKTRKVLAINHVFEILLRYTETKNWEEAFFKVIPKRKGAVVKEENSNISQSESADNSVVSDSNEKTSEDNNKSNETTEEVAVS